MSAKVRWLVRSRALFMAERAEEVAREGRDEGAASAVLWLLRRAPLWVLVRVRELL